MTNLCVICGTKLVYPLAGKIQIYCSQRCNEICYRRRLAEPCQRRRKRSKEAIAKERSKRDLARLEREHEKERLAQWRATQAWMMKDAGLQ